MFSSIMFGVYAFAVVKSLMWVRILYISNSDHVANDLHQELWHGATPWFATTIFGLIFIATYSLLTP